MAEDTRNVRQLLEALGLDPHDHDASVRAALRELLELRYGWSGTYADIVEAADEDTNVIRLG